MASPRVAIFPGTFDPPTLGHLDVIRRAAPVFDTLIVAILDNSSKDPFFSLEERATMLRKIVAGMRNVEVDTFGGLLAEYARTRKAGVIVRGIRGAIDFEYEQPMAENNRHLNPAVDTIFLAPSAAVAHISSSRVREIAGFGGPVKDLVPDTVAAALAARRPGRQPKRKKS